MVYPIGTNTTLTVSLPAGAYNYTATDANHLFSSAGTFIMTQYCTSMLP